MSNDIFPCAAVKSFTTRTTVPLADHDTGFSQNPSQPQTRILASDIMSKPFPICRSQSGTVMTRSMPGANPVPAPAQPRTNPRRFIADVLHVASRHVTPSRHAPPHDVCERVMECAAPRGPCGFSHLPYIPPYCVKGPVEPRSKISLVIKYHCHEILSTPHL